MEPDDLKIVRLKDLSGREYLTVEGNEEAVAGEEGVFDEIIYVSEPGLERYQLSISGVVRLDISLGYIAEVVRVKIVKVFMLEGDATVEGVYRHTLIEELIDSDNCI